MGLHVTWLAPLRDKRRIEAGGVEQIELACFIEQEMPPFDIELMDNGNSLSDERPLGEPMRVQPIRQAALARTG